MNYGPPIKPKGPRPPASEKPPSADTTVADNAAYAFLRGTGLLMMFGSGLCGTAMMISPFRGPHRDQKFDLTSFGVLLTVALVGSGIPFFIGYLLYRSFRKR